MDWDARYAEPGYTFGEEANDFLAKHFNCIPKGNVLCLAEGEGRNAVFLAKQGYRVTAVDASAVGLDKAMQLADKHNVEIETLQADLAEYVIEPNYWQGIVSIFCHLPVELRTQVHASVSEGLVKGGCLILEAYTPAQIEFATGGPSNPERCMTLNALRQELVGLDWQHGLETERDVIEGKYHVGRASVVQVIAGKT